MALLEESPTTTMVGQVVSVEVFGGTRTVSAVQRRTSPAAGCPKIHLTSSYCYSHYEIANVHNGEDGKVSLSL